MLDHATRFTTASSLTVDALFEAGIDRSDAIAEHDDPTVRVLSVHLLRVIARSALTSLAATGQDADLLIAQIVDEARQVWHQADG
jgi:hypothetical protein